MRHLPVSVCIPTFRNDYLAQTLAGVLEQTFGEFEVLVVDDASQEATEHIVAACRDARVRYVRNGTNLGMVANWNHCVDLARGELVAILHDDDLWRKEYLQRVVNILKKHEHVGLVCSATEIMDEDGVTHAVNRAWSEERIMHGEEAFRELIFANRIFASSVIVRRQCYDQVGRFDVTVLHAADWEMWLRIFLAYDVGYIAEPLALYRVHSKRTTDRTTALGDAFVLQHDACAVVERGMRAAITAGRHDLAVVARRSLAHHWFEIAHGRRRVGDPGGVCRELARAWAASPRYVLARLHLVVKIVAYTAKAWLLLRAVGRRKTA